MEPQRPPRLSFGLILKTSAEDLERLQNFIIGLNETKVVFSTIVPADVRLWIIKGNLVRNEEAGT